MRGLAVIYAPFLCGLVSCGPGATHPSPEASDHRTRSGTFGSIRLLDVSGSSGGTEVLTYDTTIEQLPAGGDGPVGIGSEDPVVIPGDTTTEGDPEGIDGVGADGVDATGGEEASDGTGATEGCDPVAGCDAADGGDGATDTGGGATDAGTDIGTDGEETDQARGECAARLHLPAERIHVAGSQKRIVLDRSDALLVKVTGNHNQVLLNLKTADGAQALTIPGICLILAGNQSSATVSVAGGVTLGTFFHMGRGNQTAADIEVASGAKVGNLTGSLHGNQQSLKVSGAGHYECGSFDVKGNGSRLTCLSN